ncbi:MAG: hypothetical protein F7B18_01595 [Desulfurococcales archaeon]|nr:hypothetical protein [Desulfurococcales archaeon]
MIEVGPEARMKGAEVRYIIVEDIEVEPSSSVAERVQEVVSRFRATIRDMEALAKHPHVRAYRKLFWGMKVDPTKMRPSPEALARRVIRTGKLPGINSVVDSGNAASLYTLISIGLYDLDRVEAPLRVKVLDGGVFQPIGGGEIKAPRGMMGLIDARGRIIHLYAHRDSRETMITGATRRVLAVSYGAPGIRSGDLEGALRLFLELLEG